jgi:hypothetical protein
VGSWRRPAAWDNLALGLRLGTDPRVCATFTPRGTSLVKAILASPTTRKTGGTTYENARHLAPEFIESTRARYEGTRLGRQEVYAELLEQLEGCWFHDFDPARNVTTEAEWDPALAARLAVDCGVSRYTGAVFYQVRELGPYRHRVTVFGDYLAADRMSADNAGALRELSMSLCNGRLERVRLDPASSAHTGVGPAALAEYQQAFGTRILAFWLMHGVTDGLDTLELLVGSATREPDLLIHPRCVHLIQAFNGYTRELWGGEWMPWPDPLQHPAEDLMDALRGGVRDALPEGRKPQPAFRRVPAWGVF